MTADMTVADMDVRVSDARALASLLAAFDGLERVEAVTAPDESDTGTSGAGRRRLVVFCADNTAVGLAARAVRTWVEATRAPATIVVEGTTLQLSGGNADTMIPKLLMLLLAAKRRKTISAG